MTGYGASKATYGWVCIMDMELEARIRAMAGMSEIAISVFSNLHVQTDMAVYTKLQSGRNKIKELLIMLSRFLDSPNRLLIEVVLPVIFLFSSCQGVHTKTSPPIKKRLIALLPCQFEKWSSVYYCSVYNVSDSNLYYISVTKDSASGDIAYEESLYKDQGQLYHHIQIGEARKGQYLILFWISGNVLATKIIDKKEGKVQVIESFFPDWLEFADVDNDAINDIIVSVGEYEAAFEGNTKEALQQFKITRFPDSAKIYSWKTGNLKLVNTVPWKKRLCNK